MKNTAYTQKYRGFTMIELMVAIAISAILMVVLAQVYASTKRTYRINEGLSRMQETGRYSVDLISRDMRLAGYMGCVGTTTNISNMANPISGWSPLNTTTSPPSIEGVIGYEQSSLPTSGTAFALLQAEVKANTDVVQIQHLSATSAKLVNPSPTNANIQINGNPLAFQQYELLVVTDCTWADIFKATSVSTSGSTVTIAHSNSNNTGNTTSVNYGENAEVMRFESNVYYVGADPQTSGACPANTLCRKRLGMYLNADANKWCTNATASTTQGFCVEQVAEGVEDFQILYGIDNNGDLSADTLVPASSITTNNCTTSTTCWPNVVSMRINLLLRSTDTNLQPQAVTTYPASQIPLFSGATPPTITSATSRAYRRVHTETINLRNRTL